MNKLNLIDNLQKVLSTKKEAKDALENIFSNMKKAITNDEKVVISGFGSFRAFTTKPKGGRNPKTGQRLQITPRKKIRFKIAKDFFK